LAFTIPETIASRPGSATPGERKVFVALRELEELVPRAGQSSS
jgi:hypothetical protein